MKEIPLTQGRVALVDDEDYECLASFRWCANRKGSTFYAVFRDHKKSTYMHRLLLSAPADMLVDHISGDGLDNRRQNIRLATRAQNGMNRGRPANNTSGFKGVHFEVRTGRWRADIASEGGSKCLGRFPDPEEAYAAYCDAAKELHGEFARVSA